MRRRIDPFKWHQAFALLPVTTISGRRAWFKFVERRWNDELNPWSFESYTGYDGGWEYRLPLTSYVKQRWLTEEGAMWDGWNP